MVEPPEPEGSVRSNVAGAAVAAAAAAATAAAAAATAAAAPPTLEAALTVVVSDGTFCATKPLKCHVAKRLRPLVDGVGGSAP